MRAPIVMSQHITACTANRVKKSQFIAILPIDLTPFHTRDFRLENRMNRIHVQGLQCFIAEEMGTYFD